MKFVCSIRIPLEQGLRHALINQVLFVQFRSIRIPLEQGLRPLGS